MGDREERTEGMSWQGQVGVWVVSRVVKSQESPGRGQFQEGEGGRQQ